MAKLTNNQIEKKMSAGGQNTRPLDMQQFIKLASRLDDYTPEGINIRRIIELSEAFDDAVKNGFEGTREDFIKSLPEEELRKFYNSGGKVISFISEKEKRRPEKSIRKLDLASQFAPDTTLAELDDNQRATLNTLLRLTFGKKD